MRILTTLLCIIPLFLIAQNPKDSWFDVLHQKREITSITIFTELDSIMANIRTEKEFEAKLLFRDGPMAGDSWKINLQVRGRYRRRACDFPPLKITVSKKQLKAYDLKRKWNDYKLVTHCLDKKSDAYVLREYLAYRLLNQLTQESFRVQLVRVNYEDTNGNYQITDRLGIILEDDDQMAHRLGGEISDTFQLAETSIVKPNAHRHALFQYMIGNCDWSLPFRRNIRIVRTDDEKLLLVPYDFDFSGLVDAPYAVPDPNYNQLKVTDRIFLGAASFAEMENTITEFQQQRNELLELCSNLHYLKKRHRKRARKYIKGFYQDLDSGELYYPPSQ